MSRSGARVLTGSKAAKAAKAVKAKPAGQTNSRSISRNQTSRHSQSRSKVMSDETNNSHSSNESPAGAESLDKVRDILFGVQMRDYDHRFSQLEERLMREATLLREDVKKRFD